MPDRPNPLTASSVVMTEMASLEAKLAHLLADLRVLLTHVEALDLEVTQIRATSTK